jgi:hypothetical protein
LMEQITFSRIYLSAIEGFFGIVLVLFFYRRELPLLRKIFLA